MDAIRIELDAINQEITEVNAKRDVRWSLEAPNRSIFLAARRKCLKVGVT
jgi:hypothetical protein